MKNCLIVVNSLIYSCTLNEAMNAFGQYESIFILGKWMRWDRTEMRYVSE